MVEERSGGRVHTPPPPIPFANVIRFCSVCINGDSNLTCIVPYLTFCTFYFTCVFAITDCFLCTPEQLSTYLWGYTCHCLGTDILEITPVAQLCISPPFLFLNLPQPGHRPALCHKFHFSVTPAMDPEQHKLLNVQAHVPSFGQQ